MQSPTRETIQQWKSLYEQYKSQIRPNAKTVAEVIAYLKQRYPLNEESAERLKDIVVANIQLNEPLAAKIPEGKPLAPIVFSVPNEANARTLYETRDEVYRGGPIIVGFESETGFFLVEGSDELHDEITAFRGLDASDLQNYYLVANYVRCLQKYNRLEEVINHSN